MTELRWLLIGAGDIARKRVAAALQQPPLSRLEAICSRSAGRAAELASAVGVPHWFDDLDRALEQAEVDAVYIATPVDTHLPLALAALRAGKHVLVEKPLALDAGQGRRLVNEAASRGLVAACAYYRRCSARYAHLKQMLAEGAFGTVLSVRLHYASWYAPQGDSWRVDPERSGGGPLADMGSHMFDLVTGLFGRPALTYAALRNRVQSYAAEDSAIVTAELPGGIALQADIHWCSRTWGHELEVIGSEARVRWSPFDSGPVVRIVGRERDELELPPAANVHAPLVEDFVHAVTRKTRPACPAAEAVLTDEFLDAVRSYAKQEKECLA